MNLSRTYKKIKKYVATYEYIKYAVLVGGIIVAVTLLIIMRAQMSVSQARIFTKNEVYTIGWDRGRAMELRFCKKKCIAKKYSMHLCQARLHVWFLIQNMCI